MSRRVYGIDWVDIGNDVRIKAYGDCNEIVCRVFYNLHERTNAHGHLNGRSYYLSVTAIDTNASRMRRVSGANYLLCSVKNRRSSKTDSGALDVANNILHAAVSGVACVAHSTYDMAGARL